MELYYEVLHGNSTFAQTLRETYLLDNPGSLLIKDRYPHLWGRLEELTYGWSLVGKFALHNADILEDFVYKQRQMIEMFPDRAPIRLRGGVTVKDSTGVWTLETYGNS